MGKWLKDNWLGLLISAVGAAVIEGSLYVITTFKDEETIRDETRRYLEEKDTENEEV